MEQKDGMFNKMATDLFEEPPKKIQFVQFKLSGGSTLLFICDGGSFYDREGNKILYDPGIKIKTPTHPRGIRIPAISLISLYNLIDEDNNRVREWINAFLNYESSKTEKLKPKEVTKKDGT